MTNLQLSFSVIINTLDRASSLRTLLRALEQQSYAHFEVIVVVGPTRDDTMEVLAEYAGRVVVRHCPKANLSTSRNIGLLAAAGDIVAFIDDDAVPSRRWLEQLARLFENPGLDATGGIVYSVHPNHQIVQHRLGIISSLAEQFDVRASHLDKLVPEGEAGRWVERMMGTNMAYRRQALLDVQGFDEFYEWLFDDGDVALRLTAAGKNVQPVTELPVYHVPASSRNRQVYTYNVKWWIQTKSVIYFCLKNGAAGAETPTTIARRSYKYVRSHWKWSKEMLENRQLNFRQFSRMRAGEIGSVLSALNNGLRPRRLLSATQAAEARKATHPLRLFQDYQSDLQATVDPVSGYRPDIKLVEPPLRICLLSGVYPPSQYEGVGRLTNLMARGLFELGHTVHVITRAETENVTFYDGAYVHRLPLELKRYGRYASLPNLYYPLNYSHNVFDKVKSLIYNDGIQLVDSPNWQFEGLVTALSGVIPVAVRLVTAMRQIGTLHNNQDAGLETMGHLEQLLIEQASYLLPNSQGTLQALEEVYHHRPDPARYSLVPYGIEPIAESATRPFEPGRADKPLTVLFVGRLEKRKGILTLFEAIDRVLERTANVRFIIAGSDNSHNDGFAAQTGQTYQAYFAERYPARASRVEFRGGVDEAQLAKLYQDCDLFVAPSLYESFGLVYLEAMNYAKPVIGCRAGGVPDVIEDGLTGHLVEPDAPAALAEAILSLVRQPHCLREMGLAGRQRLVDKFSYLTMARNYAQAYRRLLQSSPGRVEQDDTLLLKMLR